VPAKPATADDLIRRAQRKAAEASVLLAEIQGVRLTKDANARGWTPSYLRTALDRLHRAPREIEKALDAVEAEDAPG
jgi:hypothetical protein